MIEFGEIRLSRQAKESYLWLLKNRLKEISINGEKRSFLIAAFYQLTYRSGSKLNYYQSEKVIAELERSGLLIRILRTDLLDQLKQVGLSKRKTKIHEVVIIPSEQIIVDESFDSFKKRKPSNHEKNLEILRNCVLLLRDEPRIYQPLADILQFIDQDVVPSALSEEIKAKIKKLQKIIQQLKPQSDQSFLAQLSLDQIKKIYPQDELFNPAV